MNCELEGDFSQLCILLGLQLSLQGRAGGKLKNVLPWLMIVLGVAIFFTTVGTFISEQVSSLRDGQSAAWMHLFHTRHPLSSRSADVTGRTSAKLSRGS